jgi:hypothetical protein
MKAIVFRWLTILMILAVGYVLYLKRYPLEAKIWHWRHGYSTRMGDYEVPVPEHWLIVDQDSAGFTLLNTAPNLPHDGKLHTTAVVNVFPFRNHPIGPAGLVHWRTLQHQWLEQEGVKRIEEKAVSFNGQEVTCIGSNFLREKLLRSGRKDLPDVESVSIHCMSPDSLEIMFVGEPSDVQPFYTLVSQIRPYEHAR